MAEVIAEIPHSPTRCVRLMSVELFGQPRAVLQEFDRQRGRNGNQWSPTSHSVRIRPEDVPSLIEALQQFAAERTNDNRAMAPQLPAETRLPSGDASGC